MPFEFTVSSTAWTQGVLDLGEEVRKHASASRANRRSLLVKRRHRVRLSSLWDAIRTIRMGYERTEARLTGERAAQGTRVASFLSMHIPSGLPNAAKL